LRAHTLTFQNQEYMPSCNQDNTSAWHYALHPHAEACRYRVHMRSFAERFQMQQRWQQAECFARVLAARVREGRSGLRRERGREEEKDRMSRCSVCRQNEEKSTQEEKPMYAKTQNACTYILFSGIVHERPTAVNPIDTLYFACERRKKSTQERHNARKNAKRVHLHIIFWNGTRASNSC
jgi:hypothetical protein